uniref:G-protein coupled receptors family 1 profile domain-containing protein n=1 Tax=Caenorhabditis japonica TaxID=281687 RepID=A0A8R1HYS4_CAEJA
METQSRGYQPKTTSSLSATFYAYTIHRSTCFHATFLGVVTHCLQTGIFCILAFDLFLAILIPFKYRIFHISWYFPCLYALPMCYAFGVTVAAMVWLDDEQIPMCNPPSAMIPSVRGWWYQLMLVFCFFTILFYSGAVGLLSLKIRQNSSDIRLIEKRAMRTLQVLIITFLLTRFISTGIATLVTILDVDPEFSALIHNYNVIPAMIAYCQNAYVCFFRSEDYRRLLTNQMSIYLPFVEHSASVKFAEHSSSRRKTFAVSKY